MTTQYQATPINIPRDADDVTLARLAADGNTQAFELIMRRHNRLLFRTARSILKNDSESEDALQEAYLKAWRALKSFRDDAKLSTWLVRIVVNEVLSRIRRKNAAVIPIDSHFPSQLDGGESMDEQQPMHPESQAISIQMRQLLESRIDSLPEVFRTVFVLRAVQELSVEETALALQIPEATVRTRFFRARSLLREALAREIDIATTEAFSFDGARCDRIVSGVVQCILALSKGT